MCAVPTQHKPRSAAVAVKHAGTCVSVRNHCTLNTTTVECVRDTIDGVHKHEGRFGCAPNKVYVREIKGLCASLAGFASAPGTLCVCAKDGTRTRGWCTCSRQRYKCGPFR